MKFLRVGEHTIKCIISEQEIDNLGYSVDDILTNGARTQEFMNHIFDLAEQEFHMKFDMGIKTVRADFLPDHTVALTFSEHPVTGMAEHLKDIVNGIINSIPQEKWEEIRQASEQQKQEQSAPQPNIVVALVFGDMTPLLQFAGNLTMTSNPWNCLYKYKDAFYLIMDVTDCQEKEVEAMSLLADEFASGIFAGTERMAHLMEHGRPILREDAIRQLQLLNEP